MTSTTVILSAVVVANSVLGVVVFLANRTRNQNRQYLIFTTLFSLWALSVIPIVNTQSAEQAERFIRLATYLCALIPLALHMLCLGIERPTAPLRELLKAAWVTIVCSQLVGAMTFSRFYMEHVEMVPVLGVATLVPQAHYGPGFAFSGIYYVGFFVWITWHFARKMLHP